MIPMFLAAPTLTEIIASITEVVTASIGWVGNFGETVVSTPILLLFACVPLVGLGIGLFKRLLSMR